MMWGEKPYHSLDFELKSRFGRKLYKISLDGGMTCPNRDGRLGYGGCTFCSEGGSGEFAQKPEGCGDVWQQIERAKKQVEFKMAEGGGYIAYFQSYTNTYGPVSYLEPLFTKAIAHPDVKVLSIATRPDCLPQETVDLLRHLNQEKPVWVELGLQTIHEDTAQRIHRGYSLPVFEEAYNRLKQAGITVIVHVILGLPGESKEQMIDTVRYLGGLPVDGIKLQLLHILEGTALAQEYKEEPFAILELNEYAQLVVDCISVLPESVVVHRISGDGPKSLLIAPEWSKNKKLVLNTIAKCFRERKMYQGSGGKVDK